MLTYKNFFDLKNHKFQELFDNTEYVWQGLLNIKNFLKNKLEPNISQFLLKANKKENSLVLSQTIVIYNNDIYTDNFEILETDATKEKLLVKIDDKIINTATVIYEGAIFLDDEIYIGNGTLIEPGALIKGPTYIGNNTEVRQGAYVRGNVIIGDKCVVG
ncbi:MAG TPA: glucose-1-phosphate thymidylyltransferase, partial [bacterium]|nr:glucose-1-phosphate thymidylyltransferase [bacterium]